MRTIAPSRSRALLERSLVRLSAAEAGVCLALNRGIRLSAVRAGFGLVSRLGDGVFWYVLMLALALFGGPAGRAAALQMALAGLAGLLLYRRIKSGLARERPCRAHAGIFQAARALDRYSFPSGHTLQAVLFVTIALAWFPALAPLLVPFALLVALSRVVLGLHYPTDVIIGALLGAALARAALWIFAPY